MKAKEILVDSKMSTTARFKRSSKTAMLDGHPEDPKKILNMINQSLKSATGYKFKITPMYIDKEGYWASLKYELGEYEVGITLQISWHARTRDNQIFVGSIDKPIVRARLMSKTPSAPIDLFHYTTEITTETINTLWNDVSDEIHIATNPSKRWSEIT